MNRLIENHIRSHWKVFRSASLFPSHYFYCVDVSNETFFNEDTRRFQLTVYINSVKNIIESDLSLDGIHSKYEFPESCYESCSWLTGTLCNTPFMNKKQLINRYINVSHQLDERFKKLGKHISDEVLMLASVLIQLDNIEREQITSSWSISSSLKNELTYHMEHILERAQK